jgi:hypothetical protein
VLTFGGIAAGQQHTTNAPHPRMPDTKPPPAVFPMSSDNFHKLMDWYVELAHKNSDKLTDESKSQLDLAILRVRECTAAVTANGVVTRREANACLRIIEHVQMRPRPH